MKLINMVITALALTAFLMTTAHAGDRMVGGLIIGSGTGAIIGQAVGRNVESTIVGATVGGVVGLMVGNELQRQHGSVNRHSQVLIHSQRYDDRRYESPRLHGTRDRYRNFREYRHDREDCRKIITVQKNHRKTKRVVTTICSNTPHYRFEKRHFERYDHGSYR